VVVALVQNEGWRNGKAAPRRLNAAVGLEKRESSAR
jgi:hypothetical protein